jgi:hypothetical protein
MLERDVTVEEVWDYICLNHQPNAGMAMQPLARFVSQADIGHFWGLHDWWAPVENKPPVLPTPLISQFCWYVNHAENAQPVTFMDAMVQFYNRCVAYCNAEGIDPANPGETADERRRRRNRERMAGVRGHRKVPDKVIKHDETLASTVRMLEAQCEELKAEAKAKDDELSDEVKVHQLLMIQASELRKRTKEDFKQRIEGLRAEIRNLTQKQ